MNWSKRRLAVYAILATLVLNLVVVTVALVLIVRHTTSSGGVSTRQVETIIDAHLKAHPELIRNVFVDLLKNPPGEEPAQQQAAAGEGEPTAEASAKVIAENEKALFHSPHQVVLGNRTGKTAIVLFFDYNCGFCRRAHGDMLGLIKANPDLKMVLKEYPILGEQSVETAKVAIALRMQDPTGKKYADFHKTLVSGGKADKMVALAAAKSAGADMKQLERDLTSGEIDATLTESFDLGRKLQVNGTPSYVVGNKLIVGAVGEQVLQGAINEQKI